MLAEELPAAAGGQASVAFTAPDGERLDTPERAALLAKAINDVYNMEYIINPMELAAQAAAAGQTAAADPAAAGQATDVDPSATAGQATEVDPSAADGQVAAAGGQSAPYGPLMADGVPVPASCFPLTAASPVPVSVYCAADVLALFRPG